MRAFFNIYIENYDRVDAGDVQIEQDFGSQFPSPLSVTLAAPPTISGDLAELNSNFDGDGDTDLLSGTEGLAPGESATISLVLDIELNGASGPFSNQVTASAENPSGVVRRDLSHNGSDPDPDGDGDPTEEGENDPTPIVFDSMLVGKVFGDNNANNQKDQQEVGLSGWNVELFGADDVTTQAGFGSEGFDATPQIANDTPIDTTRTDGGGDYSFSSVRPGTYELVFRHPTTNIAWYERTVEVASYSVIALDQAVTPSGLVFDSEAREVVSGVRLRLVNGAGDPIAAQCLLPGQQGQLTGLDGAYRLDLQPGVHADCPVAAEQYRIDISDVPEAYVAGPSSLIPPLELPLDVPACLERGTNPNCLVQFHHLPPTDGQSTLYFLDWILGESAETALHNHIPIDPAPGEPVEPPDAPVIGAAKELVSAALVDENTVQASFRLYLRNYGNGDALNVQVEENFAMNFSEPLVVSVFGTPTVSEGPLTVNPNFNGTSEVGLLAGTDTLAPDESGIVELTIRIVLNGIEGPLANRVLATAQNGDGEMTADPSDAGSNPDQNGNGNPSEPGENDYTNIEWSGAIFGTVFADNNADGERDDSEPNRSGWLAELLDEDGEVVESASTDEQGNYSFISVEDRAHDIRIRHPETNVTWSEKTIEASSSSVSRLDFPLAVGGITYDSESRGLIPGVSLRMSSLQGSALSDQCLLPGQQNQRVGSDGAFRLDLQPGAHADCPTSAQEYLIEITDAPEGYVVGASVLLPPEEGSLNVAVCATDAGEGAACVVQAQHQPPMDSDDTAYYLKWTLAGAAAAAFHNHIPLDRIKTPVDANLIVVSKEALTNFVAVGEPVGYEVRLTNTTDTTLRNIELRDNLPNEFNLIADSATFQDIGARQDRPGADNNAFLNSADAFRIETSGTDPVTFGPFDLAAESTAIIRYVTRASTRVRQGSYTNTAMPVIGSRIVGNSASATVNVSSDPVFEQTSIIGQVFADHDEDGERDPDEPGIPGVRLATVEGLLIETDRHGRYHVAAIEIENASRGANFILKLDPQTLPAGAEVISGNPRVLRVTQSLMSSIDFAVKLDQTRELLREEPARAVVERTVIRFNNQRIEPVRFESGFAEIPEDYAEQLQRLLDDFADRDNLRVRFVGHSDDVPLSSRIAPVYGDNQGLSEARAEEVAQFVSEQLGLDPEMVETEGRGFRQPIATNLTEEGRALNRRVEIELVFDEEITEVSEEFEQPVLSELSTEPETEISYETVSDPIEPVRFAAADVTVTEDQINALQDNLDAFVEFEIESVRLTGFSDLSPDSVDGAAGAALSQANQRAVNVGLVIMDLLDLNSDQLIIEARTTTERIATNDTAFGQSLNRRVEVEITYRRVAEIVNTRTVVVQEAQMAPTTVVEDAGRIWMTEDAFTREAQLSVIALQPVVVDENGNMAGPAQFAAHGNYAGVAESYRLDIYRAADVDLSRQIGSVSAQELSWPEAFAWVDNDLDLEPGEQLAYVLRARGANGNEDSTTVQLVDVVADGQGTLASVAPETVLGRSILENRQIVLSGSRLRVHGAGFAPGEVLQVGGIDTKADVNGSFVSEMFLPPGSAEIEVQGGETGSRWMETLRPEVDDEYTFLVGLANLTIGQDSFSGNFEALSDDDAFDESVYLDGRLAFYAKAKIQGKYLLTAQMDSTEDDLENFGDNLRRRDPRRMFRQLDPDRYYPIYGDDSTTVSDVDTQGALYVRLDWDRNQLLWGNFNTGLTDTEYLAYNRSLYGARTQIESDGNTALGDPRYSVTAFASESESAAAHVTFRATGGSIYYLKHTDVVQGSEKVWMEVRQRDTRQTIERREYVEGLDYEIDALQGRIILRQPLQPVSNDYNSAIIRSRGIDGDEVYLLVDYEFVPAGFSDDNLIAGARGKVWLNDHVGIGAARVTDDSTGEEYELQGVDLTFKSSPGTYLNVEIAESEASQNGAGFESFDGGLRFNSMEYNRPGEMTEGEAVSIEGRLDIADISEMFTGNVRGWWKDRDPGFSSGNIMQNQVIREAGVDALIRNDDGVMIQASLAEVETANNDTSVVARVQGDVTRGKVTVGGEIRYEDLSRNLGGRDTPSNVQGEALMVGARVGYELNEDQTVYAKVQTGLDEEGEYVENDRIAAGLETQINENLAVMVEASDGDRGSALSGGIEYAPVENFTFDLMSGVGAGAVSEFGGNYRLANGHELYASYLSDPDRTFGDGDMMTLGQRRDFGNRFGVYTESHFGENDRYAGANHSFGIDYATESDWILSGVVTVANDELVDDPLEREAISFGASVDRDDYKFSAKTEYRTDEGPGSQVEQYLLSSNYTRILNENSRMIGRLNLLRTDDAMGFGEHARFTEFDIGHAYRPAASERLTALTRYSYLYDAAGAYQIGGGPDQRVHILAAEALYKFSPRWEIGGKIAWKTGEARAIPSLGNWYDYQVSLAVVRARYSIMHEWDALAEYRVLEDRSAGNTRDGVLLGVYRSLSENFQIGGGYNFSDFSDDLRDAEYDKRGFFIDIVGSL